jgi:Xaa-Pro aminopeptidase
MSASAVDLAAVAPSDNLRYLLGFSPVADERACLLLVTPQDAVMVMPALNAEQTAAAVPGMALVCWADAEGPQQALAEALQRLSVSGRPRLAVDPEMRSDHLLLLLADSDAVPESAGLMLSALREVKDAEELAALAASAAVADRAMQAGFAACGSGAAEREVAEAVSASMREGGAEPEFAIVGGGANGAFPHHHTGERTFQQGDAIVIDIGGRRAGYMSDITRMAFVGEPSDRYLEVHAVVEAAVIAAMAAARPGARCGKVDRAARQVIEDAGYGEHFVHRTGHGLGLSVHESPWIMAGEQTVLRPGVVHSIEPGIYLPGEFGVRLEEIVRITQSGCERLSALPREVHLAATAP